MDTTVQTYSSSTTSGLGSLMFTGVFLLVELVIILFSVICMWRIFTKAGRPGWASIIPIYNVIVELEIIGRPAWWIILLFIPIVNVVISIMMAIELGKCFSKSTLWGIFLLILLPFIGLPILAFDSSTYSGTATTGTTSPSSQSADKDSSPQEKTS